jgi:hypothetical protein
MIWNKALMRGMEPEREAWNFPRCHQRESGNDVRVTSIGASIAGR